MSTAENLRDAIDVATALVDDATVDGPADTFSGTGIVITGSGDGGRAPLTWLSPPG